MKHKVEESKFEAAIVIGRFQPFHQGHAMLIDEALKHNKNIVVLIGSSNKERDINNALPYVNVEEHIREYLDDLGVRFKTFPLYDRPVYSDDESYGDYILEKLDEFGVKPTHIIMGDEPKVHKWFKKDFPAEIVTIQRSNISATQVRERIWNNFMGKLAPTEYGHTYRFETFDKSKDTDGFYARINYEYFKYMANAAIKKFFPFKKKDWILDDCVSYGEKLTNQLLDWIDLKYHNVTTIVNGISGGKDSTITSALFKLAGKNVVGVRLPDGEQIDIDKSRKVCKLLKLIDVEVNIGEMTTAARKALVTGINNSKLKDVLNIKEDEKLNSVYETNTPARCRMTMLYGMAALVAEQYGFTLVSNNGNFNEAYVGYFTKNGDGAGDISTISKLTISQLMCIGLYLVTRYKMTLDLLFKEPTDGMSGKADEVKLGFPYQLIDDIKLRNTYPSDYAVAGKIESMHRNSEHKRQLIPAFEPVLDSDDKKFFRE